MINLKAILGGVSAIALTLALATSVYAAPSEQAECRQDTRAALVGVSDEGTYGDVMSDVIFGNEPNMADGSLGGPNEQEPGTQAGDVLPSQSPGPFVNNPTDPENPSFGYTGGDLQSDIRAVCTAP